MTQNMEKGLSTNSLTSTCTCTGTRLMECGRCAIRFLTQCNIKNNFPPPHKYSITAKKFIWQISENVDALEPAIMYNAECKEECVQNCLSNWKMRNGSQHEDDVTVDTMCTGNRFLTNLCSISSDFL